MTYARSVIPRLIFAAAVCAVAIGVLILARNMNVPNCQVIRFSLFQGGKQAFFALLGLSTFMSLIGLPVALMAFVLGMITQPSVGIGICLTGIALSNLLAFLLGRMLGKNSKLVLWLTSVFQGKLWFNDMLNSNASSGMHWSRDQAAGTPLPLSVFSFYNAATIPHLSPLSLLSGILVTVLTVIISYSLAGSIIGCALISGDFGISSPVGAGALLISSTLLVVCSKLFPRYSL